MTADSGDDNPEALAKPAWPDTSKPSRGFQLNENADLDSSQIEDYRGPGGGGAGSGWFPGIGMVAVAFGVLVILLLLIWWLVI